MIDFAKIDYRTSFGRALRMPLRLVPRNCVLPILQGPARGFRWTVGSLTHGAWLGSYESEKQAACARLTRPGMVAYDLGANAGFYSLLLARLVGPTGRVIAFEPAPRNVSLLERHIALNAIRNITVAPLCVGDECNDVDFELEPNPCLGRVADGPTGFRVRMTTVDSFVYAEGHPAPDILKIDVEGAESRVLTGMTTVLRAARPILMIELHGHEQARECHRLLQAAGYQATGLGESPLREAAGPGTILAFPLTLTCAA